VLTSTAVLIPYSAPSSCGGRRWTITRTQIVDVPEQVTPSVTSRQDAEITQTDRRGNPTATTIVEIVRTMYYPE